MGNNQVVSYNLEKFIEEIESQTSQPNITQITTSLELLRSVFVKDPSIYLNYKIIEKEMIKLKESNLSNGGQSNTNNIERKTIKFCKLFSRIPIMLVAERGSTNFDLMLDVYIDIYEYLYKQKAFLEFFYLNTIDFCLETLLTKQKNYSLSQKLTYRLSK